MRAARKLVDGFGVEISTELHEVAYRRAGAAALQIDYDELLDGMSGRFSFGPGDGYARGSESDDDEEEVDEEGDEWDGAEEESESDDDDGADGDADGVTESKARPHAGPASPSDSEPTHTAAAPTAISTVVTTATVCAAWLARLTVADSADAPPPR